MAAIGADKAAEALALPLSTTRSWERRNSIPAKYWQAFTKRRWASLTELATSQAGPLPTPAEPQASAA